jgi:Sulfotransferase family
MRRAIVSPAQSAPIVAAATGVPAATADPRRGAERRVQQEERRPDTGVPAPDPRASVSRADPILVTGSHRSGSTWVGKMLAADDSVGYIREPFSVLHRPGILDVPIRCWFPYVCTENEGPYLAAVQDMLAFRYRTGASVRGIRSGMDAAKVAHDVFRWDRYRTQRARPLLKDPLALFSSEWLAERFHTRVLVLIRHPAGFASSLQRYRWTHPFDHFLRQPLLMRDRLEPFRRQIEEFARTEHDCLDQAILLWNLIHHTIREYQERHPDWLFYRYEDIGARPLPAFDRLYRDLGLEFSPAARRAISEHSNASNPEEARDARVLKRDSTAAVHTWRTRLSSEEIDRVHRGTQEISRAFYTDAEWEAE